MGEFITHDRAYSFAVEGVHKDEYRKALDNLERLRLVQINDEFPSELEAWKERIEEDNKPLFDELSKLEGYKSWAPSDARGFVDLTGIHLTDLGRAFANVCMKGLK
jgi:hypothetical protein